jgi:hypothetical protein
VGAAVIPLAVGDCVGVDGGVKVPVDDRVEVSDTDIVLDGEEEEVGVTDGVTDGVTEGPDPDPTKSEQVDKVDELNPVAREIAM